MAMSLTVDEIEMRVDVRPLDLSRLELPGLVEECDRATFNHLYDLYLSCKQVPCRYELNESFLQGIDFMGALTYIAMIPYAGKSDQIAVDLRVTSIGVLTLRLREPSLT